MGKTEVELKSVAEELELWKQLYDLKNYKISNFGRIKSLERNLSIGVRNGIEYFRVYPELIKAVRTNGIEPFLFTSIIVTNEKGVKKNTTFYIHRAVADHFVNKPKHIQELEKEGRKIYASHIKKDHQNNRWDNIRWIGQLELIRSQPKRLADPTKSWRTRRKKYGNKFGCPQTPKWNPNPKKRLETIKNNRK
jgi:hypothetical protein